MLLLSEILSKILDSINQIGSTNTKSLTVSVDTSSDLGITCTNGHQRLKIAELPLTLTIKSDVTSGESVGGKIRMSNSGTWYRPYSDVTLWVGKNCHKVVISSSVDSDKYFMITLTASSALTSGTVIDCNAMTIVEEI